VIASILGFFQTIFQNKFEQVNMIYSDKFYQKLQRLERVYKKAIPDSEPLKIIQITDTHLGVFMSVSRLKKVCENAVKQNPDLVFLTGDFFTLDSRNWRGALAEALHPLKNISSKTFACIGNHDYECYSEVERCLVECGIKLLIDEQVIIQTRLGNVQIIGLDFLFRGKKPHIESTLSQFPPNPDGFLRILLLHDPSGFKHVPPNDQSLVFSGHTHGGQCGLVSCGLNYTAITCVMPDHGFWARGLYRLYVHRGTGQYGFPLRLGVPNENSILNIYKKY